MEQGAYLSAPSNPWWRAKTWWSWSMSGTVASCVPAGQNTACPGWEEAWRPSGTNMMVCPGSDTRLTEVGSGSSSRSTPSTLSCMAQPVGMTTVEVSSLLAGLADASRSGCANDPRQAGSWRRRRLAGLPSSGCGPQRGTRWASGLRGGIFSMLVPMRSCLSVAGAGARQGPRQVMDLGAAVLCSGTAVVWFLRDTLWTLWDRVGAATRMTGCLLIRRGGGRT